MENIFELANSFVGENVVFKLKARKEGYTCFEREARIFKIANNSIFAKGPSGLEIIFPLDDKYMEVLDIIKKEPHD